MNRRHVGELVYHKLGDLTPFPAVWIEVSASWGTPRGLAMIDTAAPMTIVPYEYVADGGSFEALPIAPGYWAGHGGEQPRLGDGLTLSYANTIICDRFAVGEPGSMDYFILGLGDFLKVFRLDLDWRNGATFTLST